MDLVLTKKDDLVALINEAITTALANFKPVELQQQDTLLTQSEAVELLHISEPTIIQWRKDGRVPYQKIGKRVYYSRKALLNLV